MSESQTLFVTARFPITYHYTTPLLHCDDLINKLCANLKRYQKSGPFKCEPVCVCVCNFLLARSRDMTVYVTSRFYSHWGAFQMNFLLRITAVQGPHSCPNQMGILEGNVTDMK